MEVYFDASLQLPEVIPEVIPEVMKQGPCKHMQAVHAEFTAGGLKRIIPVIYCFTKGLVFDILTVMEEKAVMEYVDKYKEMESCADTLTDTQLEHIWQENPYQDIGGRYWINGDSTGTLSAVSAGELKGRPLHEHYESIQELRAAYSQYLEQAKCFFCQRICIENGTDYTKEKVTELTLVTDKSYRTELLDIKIEMNPQEKAGEAEFIHPITGRRHEIFIYDAEESRFTAWDRDVTYCSGMAEVVPELPKEDRFLFDSKLTPEKSVSREGKETQAVSVIGGAQGPVAIFAAGKVEEPIVSRHGSKPFPCFSSPQWAGADKASGSKIIFHITGLTRMVRDKETIRIL